MRFEHYAVVPGVDGISLAVVNGRLPCVGAGWKLPEVLAELSTVIGTPVYLRTAADADSARLHIFDSADTGEAVPLADADPAQLVPSGLRPAFERWLAEQCGAPVPELRTAWARPGWRAQAEAWAGCMLEPVRQWPLSAVLRGEAGYLKAVFPLFHCEPAVTAALAQHHPGSLPELIRVDHERGWMLMRELPGTVVGDSGSADGAAEALRTLAELQRFWSGRTDELFALGAQDRRVDVKLPLPDTICHGDFHPHNAAFDGERAVIFDWSDACVAQPLLDLHLFLSSCPNQDGLIEAYAEPWAGIASADEIRDVFALAEWLSCRHQAESYAAIGEAVEPDDRALFQREAQRWRERGNASQPG
jgi:hypothetical protein